MAEKKTTTKTAEKKQTRQKPTTKTVTGVANESNKKISKNSFTGYCISKTADLTIINFTHRPSEDTLKAVKNKYPKAKIYLPNGAEV